MQMDTKLAKQVFTPKGWLMLILLIVLLPLVLSNYFFHDDMWMLGWSTWAGREMACGHSDLFWGSYFMDGRFFSAFTADCMVKPVMNWVYDHGDIYTAQTVIVGCRVVSLLFFSLFVWQMAKLLEATPSTPITAAASILSVVMLPGVLFMILWGHAVVFNVSFLLTAIFTVVFRKSITGALVRPWPLLFIATLLVSFVGYGLYTISGLYLVIPVVLYLALADNFEWNSREEKAVRIVLLGIIAATLAFAVAQKTSAIIFNEHISANGNAHIKIDQITGSQLLLTVSHLIQHFVKIGDPIFRVAFLWFIPDGYLSDKATLVWMRLSGLILHTCLFGSLWLLLRRKAKASVAANMQPRLFYLLGFFVLSVGFLALSRSEQDRVIFVAQSAYVAIAIALLRHFRPFLSARFAKTLNIAPVIFVSVLLVFMNWYVLNSILLISAREEGALSSMFYALRKGEVSSVTVRFPNTMVPPDSFGPSLLFDHRPEVVAKYLLSSPQGVKSNNISFDTDLRSWFRFRNLGVGDQPGAELYFDAREMLPRLNLLNFAKINAAEKSAILVEKPLLAVSTSNDPKYVPNDLLSGGIWHSEEAPKYPQWVKIIFSKPLNGTSVSLWHQPSHAERFPKELVVHGYLDGREVGSFSPSPLSCIPGETPSSIDLAVLGRIDTVVLSVQSNCGDAQYISIGKLEIQ